MIARESPEMNFKLKTQINRSDVATIRHALTNSLRRAS
jgi:hypothetical protein